MEMSNDFNENNTVLLVDWSECFKHKAQFVNVKVAQNEI